MKKNILIFIIVLSHTTTYTMLLTKYVPRSSRIKPTNRRMTTPCKHPYIADVYSTVLNEQIPNCEKQEIINHRLDHDVDLGHEEKHALLLLRKIILPDQQSTTLLHTIVEQNDNDLLSIAFSYGLIKHIDAQDQRLNTPIYIAATHGYTSLVQTLLDEKANPNTRNERKRTPLFGALIALDHHHSPFSYTSFVDIMKRLKSAGADAFIPDDSNKTVFNYISEIINGLEDHRSRTMYNEDGELIAMYTSLYNLLKE